MWPFAVIILVPLTEIALFVTLGGWLGLWLTLAIVLGTGVLGVMVIRWQGLQAMHELRKATQRGRDPLGPVADSALTAFAGMLLILPGFLTDTLGLLLLIPQVRAAIIAGIAARVRVRHPDAAAGRRSGADILDGEFFEIEPDRPDPTSPPGPPSGWTRH